MNYSIDVDRARTLAAMKHAGAVDKAGAPYIDHPARVAARFDDPELKVIAWLHDLVEDTDVSLTEILDAFGPDTAEAIDALTHRKGEPWAVYLARVKLNPVATAVKISDLIDNSNLSRMPVVTAKDVKRQAKYNRALYFLMDVDGE